MAKNRGGYKPKDIIIDRNIFICHKIQMIDKSLTTIWAKAAAEYLADNSRLYRNCISDASSISRYLEIAMEANFIRTIDKRNIYDDDVEEKIERIFDNIVKAEKKENGDKMTRVRAMAEALKITYSMGLNLN